MQTPNLDHANGRALLTGVSYAVHADGELAEVTDTVRLELLLDLLKARDIEVRFSVVRGLPGIDTRLVAEIQTPEMRGS